jgi:hypothetical protein
LRGREVNVPDVQTNEVPTECPEGQECNKMIRHCGKSPLVGAVINARRLTLTAFVIVISGAIASPQASALTIYQGSKAIIVTGDGGDSYGHISQRNGNGKFNKNYSTVNSPTVNRGLQQVSNTNLSGQTNTQVAFCRKKHRVCKISQRLWTR